MKTDVCTEVEKSLRRAEERLWKRRVRMEGRKMEEAQEGKVKE